MVFNGRLAPTSQASQEVALQSRALWAFPIDHFHGWQAEQDERCEVMVRHLPRCQTVLEEHLPTQGYYQIKLDPTTLAHLRRLRERNKYCFMSQPTYLTCKPRFVVRALCLALSTSDSKPLASGDGARRKPSRPFIGT